MLDPSSCPGAANISYPYLTTMLRLIFLALDLVEAILDGRQGEDVTLEAEMAVMSVVWGEQRQDHI